MFKFLISKTRATRLIISILICLSAGFVGSVFTTPAILGWYANLNKPSFSPPNWLFAPVWTFLFILMGISLALIWSSYAKASEGKGKKKIKVAITIFIVQLVLNTMWSVLFFGLKLPLLAFIEILFLWLAILFTIIKFYKISKPAAYLLLPYLAWVSFASFLNFTIYRLN